jgi:hypothetical protein
MLQKKLYVLLSKPLVPPETLEKRGLVFASGPLTESGAEPAGYGLTILRTKDAGEARAVAEAEPFFVHGLRSFELKEWTVMEGTLGLRINLSDQCVEIE